MKVIYLVTTCAYCMQFIANYLTVVTEILFGYGNADFYTMSPWGIWGIYCFWLTALSVGMFYFYNKQKSHEQLISQAYILFYAVLISVGLLIFLLFICFSEKFKQYLYREVCHNLNSDLGDLAVANYKWNSPQCCING